MVGFPQSYPQQNPQPIRFFVIIVHYGQKEPTDRLITGLLASPSPLELIVVVDHAVERYREYKDKKIKIVRPSTNEGFGAGINVGLGTLVSQGAKLSDIIIVMNNDLQLTGDIMTIVINWWEHQTKVDQKKALFILAGKEAGKISYLTGRTRRAVLPPYDYIDGAFLTASYNVFIQLKGVPDQYFLYWEDVALGAQARRKNIRLMTIPSLPFTHSSEGSSDKLYYLVRNGAYYLSHTPPGLIRNYWRLVNHIRHLYHRVRPTTATSTTIIQALTDARRGVLGKRSIKSQK